MIQPVSPSFLTPGENVLGLGTLVKAHALSVILRSVVDGPFAGKQIDAGIGVGRDVAEPACELVNHQARGDTGGVDRAPRSAGSLLGFGCGEEC